MTRTIPKCEICKVYYADYALQYIGDDVPQFYNLGWHIRGFEVIKVCSDCKESIRAKYMLTNNRLQGHITYERHTD